MSFARKSASGSAIKRGLRTESMITAARAARSVVTGYPQHSVEALEGQMQAFDVGTRERFPIHSIGIGDKDDAEFPADQVQQIAVVPRMAAIVVSTPIDMTTGK